jgi:hypothetical protein
MTGKQYAALVAAYIAARFGKLDLEVYREVDFGKSIIGKNRKIDVLCVLKDKGLAFGVECKFQGTKGTTDEKIPYALEDMRAAPVAGCVAYAGTGFSQGVLHMLSAARDAAYCLPKKGQSASTRETRELDHLIAAHFGWWHLLLEGKHPV